MEYIFLSILIFTSSCLELFLKNKKVIYVYFYLVTIILIIFTGFRFNVGYDYFSYEKIFIEIKSLNFKELLEYKFSEIGYIFLNKIYTNYNFLLFSIALFNIVIKTKALKKISYYPILSFFIYYSINYLNSDFGKIRNAIATTFLLLSISEIKNKTKSFILIMCGSLFHYSLIAMTLILFIKPKIYSKKKYLALFFITFIFFSLYFQNLLNLILIYLPEYIQQKIFYYRMIEMGNKILTVNISLVLRILFCIYFFLFSKKFDEKEKIYFNIYFIGVILYPVLMVIPQLLRIPDYYKVVECILFASILKKNYTKTKATIILLFFLIYSIFNVFKIVYNSRDEFIPYKNYLIEVMT